MDWWTNFTTLEQILFTVAIFSLAVFVVQTIVTLFGGVDGDVEIDAEGEGGSWLEELFTVRNLLSFLTGFSWISLGLMQMGLWPIVALPIGFAAGTLFAWINMAVFYGLSQLHTEGNVNLNEVVGDIGRITLGSPAGSPSMAKVQVTVGDRQIELLARSQDRDQLERNMTVRIVALEGETAVVASVQ